ncbi:hypothetical protein DM01DRAFT_1117238 [Hesseltinella vesiculosa]|uniref:RAVE complex protein Rav1 C-terminal domain-containing protein n=1 Tax=Hesseltinella vesiculosa TaxID=101127 RepID=A0A1X2G9J3_9FUNG|nr:hypothetical protein DM01DRAFT_1117238 [Hesseltinella vesiculosa]
MLLAQVCAGQSNDFAHCIHVFICNGERYVAYASGNKVVIYTDTNIYIQTMVMQERAANYLVTAITSHCETRQLAIAYGCFVEFFKFVPDIQSWVTIDALTLPKQVYCLDWNAEGLLVIAGETFMVWHQMDSKWQELWSMLPPNPIIQAQFSSNGMIATIGKSDRLVTLWHRTQDENPRYDFIFLTHPREVSMFTWKQLPSGSNAEDCTLFTMSHDGVGRFWSPMDLQQPHQLYLCAVIDPSQSLLTADSSTVSPSSSSDQISHQRHQNHDHHQDEFSPIHYIGCDELRAAMHVHHLRQQSAKQSLALDQQLNKVKELIRDTPDLLFRLQPDGSIIFWGVQYLNTWPRRIPRTFVMLRIDQAISPIDRTFFLQHVHIVHDYAHVQSMSTVKPVELSLIARNPHGELRCYGLNLIDFLDSTPFEPLLRLKFTWVGHQQPITAIHQSSSNRLCTMSLGGQTNVWSYDVGKTTGQLTTQLLLDSSTHLPTAKFSIPIDNGRLLAVYDGTQVLVYSFDSLDCHLHRHVHCPNYDPSFPLSSLHVRSASDSRHSSGTQMLTLFGVSQSTSRIFSWQIEQTQPDRQPSIVFRGCQALDWPAEPNLVILNDRWVGSTAAMLLYDLAVTHSKAMALAVVIGSSVYMYGIQFEYDQENDIKWEELYHIDTSLQHIHLTRCINNIMAIASQENQIHTLSLWMDIRTDMPASLVFSIDLTEPIQDLAWYMSSDAQLFLAVALPSKVVIFGQERASDVAVDMDAWCVYTEILLRHEEPISGVAWVENGVLVLTTGNQVRCYTKWLTELDTPVDEATSLFDLSYSINGALPLYHPRYLLHYLLWGKLDLVNHVLLSVYQALKLADDLDLGSDGHLNDIAPPCSLSTVLEIQKSHSKKSKKQQSYDALFDDGMQSLDQEDPSRPLTSQEAKKCKDFLKDRQLTGLSDQDQMQLIAMIDTYVEISKQGESLDENGARFTALLENHFHLNQMLPDGQRQCDLSSRDITYALHSNSQDTLLEQCLRLYDGKLLWPDARSLGLFLWLRKSDVVVYQMEAIARNTYLSKQEDKNPVDCTLFYLALRKKNLLQSLWRTAHGHNEQRVMMSFLANDFSEQRWQRAAAKNAFVLLGKQRFEYAAAFFLLADKLKDCVNVILKHLKDYQLAIAVCRVYEGDQCPLIKEIIQKHMLPAAKETKDRWLLTIAYWLLGQYSDAIRSMIVPFAQIESAAASDAAAMVNDPTLFILYQYVKVDNAQSHQDLNISPELEYLFTLQVTRSYERLGCPLLALHILTRYPAIRPIPPVAAISPASDDGQFLQAAATESSDIFAPRDDQTAVHRAADLFASDDDDNNQPAPVDDIFADMPSTKMDRAADLFASDYDDSPQQQADIFADMPAATPSSLSDLSDGDDQSKFSDDPMDKLEMNISNADEDLSSYKALLVIRMLQMIFHSVATNQQSRSFDLHVRDQYLKNRQALFETGESLNIPTHLFSTLLMEKTIEADTFPMYMDILEQHKAPSDVDVKQFLVSFQLGCCQVFEALLTPDSALDYSALAFFERWIIDMMRTFTAWNTAIRQILPHMYNQRQTFKLCLAAYVGYLVVTTKQRHYEKSWVLLCHISRFMEHILEDDPVPVIASVFQEILNNEAKLVEMETEDFESFSDDSLFGFDLNEEQYKPKEEYKDTSAGAVVLEAATLNFVLDMLEFGLHHGCNEQSDALVDFVWTSLLDPLAYRVHILHEHIDVQLDHDPNRSNVLKQFKTLRQKKYWHSLKTLAPVSDLLPFVHFTPPEVNVLSDGAHHPHTSIVYNPGTTIHAFCMNNKSPATGHKAGDLFAVCTKNEIQEIDVTKSQRFVPHLVRPGSSSSREWPHHDILDSYPDTEEELETMSSDVDLDVPGTAEHHGGHGLHHGVKSPANNVRRGLHHQVPSSSRSSGVTTPVSNRYLQPEDRHQHGSHDNLHESIKRSLGIVGRDEGTRSPTGTSSVGSTVEQNERMITLRRHVTATCAETHPQYPFYITGCDVVSDGPSAILWQFGQDREIANYYGCHGKVTRIHFDPYGQKFGAGDASGSLCLWKFDAHIQSHRPYYSMACHSKATRDFTFLNASSLLATVGTSQAMSRK